jgi:hypothetical protein
MREDIDPITEALDRLVTTLDVIGLEAFVPAPPRAAARAARGPSALPDGEGNEDGLDRGRFECDAGCVDQGASNQKIGRTREVAVSD